MSQPSILQSLGGPLGGKKFEFRGGDVAVGTAPDCAVRIQAPGVEAHHARILIEITGATIYRVDGPIGVNDDVVTTDTLLRSGDFVWIGEPGGPTSLMFQFTLGDVEEAASAPAAEAVAAAEEIVVEDIEAPAAPSEAGMETPSTGATPEEPMAQPAAMESPDSSALSTEAMSEPAMAESPASEPPMAEPGMAEPAMAEPAIDEAPATEPTMAEATAGAPIPEEAAPV